MAKKTKKRAASSGSPKVVLTKTSDNSKKKKDAKKIIIGVVSYILLTFILLFSQYSKLLGTPGEFIKNFLLGLFGSVSLAFPFIMAYDFIYYFRQKNKNGSLVKVWSTVVLIFNVSAIFHMLSSGKEKMTINIENLYNGGIQKTLTGGIVGGFFGEIFKYIGYYFGITLLFIILAALSFIILYEPVVALYKFIVKYCDGLEKPEIERKPKEKKKPIETASDKDSDFDKIMDVHNEYSDVDEKTPQGAGGKNSVTDAEQHVIDEKDRLDKILMGIEQKELPQSSGDEPQAPDYKDAKAPDEANFEEPAAKLGEEAPIKTENDEIILPDNKLIEYKFPTIELLDDSKTDYKKTARDIGKLKENASRLEEILRSFGVKAEVVNIERGPTITRYELQPASGVRVTKIMSLQDDIKMNLAATSIRIAPIPGKTVIGVEVPNETPTPVVLKDLVSSDKFRAHKSKLAFTVGMDITGNPVIGDISKMPHVLIAGATGSGKSVCINCIITSILYKANPNEVKLIMVDPKVVELSVYNGIPHLLLPVVTDPRKATGALNWAVMEMENRYRIFAEYGVRNIQGYNEHVQKSGEADSYMPQIVIIIDELSDLMMVSPKDVEKYICRLAQLARAAGIHLVIATQRPSVNVITGLIKANVPSRIAFAVSSFIDSKTILDMGGAEKLLGKGDMLYHPMGEPKPIRIQGAYVSDKEVERIVNVIKANSTAAYNEDIMEHLDNFRNEEDAPAERQDNAGDADALLPQAIETVLESGQASTSFLQRRLGLGYARAAKIIDQMEARGIVGPSAGSKPREILITKEQFYEMQMKGQ